MAKKETSEQDQSPEVHEQMPKEGGRYIRNKDGSLTKVLPAEPEPATPVAENNEG